MMRGVGRRSYMEGIGDSIPIIADKLLSKA